MRISDWSSDVCSSDLWRRTTRRQGTHHRQKAAERGIVIIGSPDGREGQDILRVADRLEHDIRINHGGTGFANNTKAKAPARPSRTRSEEHTSELHSLMLFSFAVFSLTYLSFLYTIFSFS